MSVYSGISVLTSFLGQPKAGTFLSQGQLSFNCPRCRDHNYGQWDNKYNLDVTFPGSSRPPLIASCWKCGAELSMPISRLVREYGQREQQTAWKAYEATLGPQLRRPTKAKAHRQAELPEDFERVRAHSQDPYHQAAWFYLTQVRQVPAERVIKLGFGVSKEPRWLNRVLLPSYDENENLNFVIGREILDTPNVPPYQTSYGVSRTDIIFNEHTLDWNQPILLTEGIFDYVAYPYNNTPYLGKNMAPGSRLEQQLRKYKPPIIVAVDMDAAEATPATHSTKVNNALISRGVANREDILQRCAELGLTERYYLELPHNDLGEVLRVEGALNVPGIVAAGIRPDKIRDVSFF